MIKKAMLCALALAGATLCGLPAPAAAQGFAVNVVGIEKNGTETPVSQYKWTLEEDLTYHVIPGVPDPNTIAVRLHSSYMPVVATGDETTPLPPLDPAKYYYLSVLPKLAGSYTIGGGAIRPGDTSVTIGVNALPLPTAQFCTLVFEDNHPLNGTPDMPIVAGFVPIPGVTDVTEQGLAGFRVTIEEPAGRYGMSGGKVSQDAFGNQIGTVYQRDPLTNEVILDVNGAPIIASLGDGFVVTNSDGIACIKNLSPGKYGTLVVPPAGQGWQQTATIEGTKVVDAWVKPDEPAFFTEFGPPGFHVFVGFIRPFADATVLNGGETLSGTVTNLHTARPPEVGFFSGAPMSFTTPWVALNQGALGLGGAVYAAEASEDGTFSIPNVSPGAYQLVVFDKNLDMILATMPVTVNPGPAGGCVNPPLNSCDFGDVPVFSWFARHEHWTFIDDGGGNPLNAENGFFDAGEIGLPLQNINLRWRDGTVYQTLTTNLDGFVTFDQVFPFFAWLVAEVDYGRYKDTGLTVVVDGGGAIDPVDPWSFGGQLTPQPQPENGFLPYRTQVSTAPGDTLLQAFQQFLGQTSVFMWGKVPYQPDENGGISGIVFYSTTRAEDEPVHTVGETWEPGIPGVTVNLWDSSGTILLNTTTTDSWDATPPTGCVGDTFVFRGVPTDCFDGLRNFNQARPGVFDGGYLFNTIWDGGGVGLGNEIAIPAGDYVVEVVAPAGYKHYAEESKNVDFGDDYVSSSLPAPALLVGPEDCVGPLHTVPAELELFPGVPAHNAGQQTALCSHKKLHLSSGQNAASDFFLYTETPIAAHIYGFILDDTANEFDPNAPNFGEKFAPPWMPISVQDFRGREIDRTYSDEYGVYNVLVPSTYSVNVPSPSGVSPAMYTVCLNSPGHFEADGTWVPDPWHNPQYSQFCYTFQYMPGTTTYLDTPVLPIASHAGQPQNPLDCEPLDGTPKLNQVNGPSVSGVPGGPYVSAVGEIITIASEGSVFVPNPGFDGVGGVEPKTVTRDFGFGTIAGTVTIGGVPLNVTSWTASTITGTVAPGTTTGDVVVTRGDNGKSTVEGVKLTVGGSAPIYVDPSGIIAGSYPSIEQAIDNAAVGDLILVTPGNYFELVVMWKPVRLQGYGPGAVTINAVKSPAEKLQNWRSKIDQLVALAGFDLAPGQELLVGSFEGNIFVTEQGPAIIVLGKDRLPASGGYGLVGGEPNARIDGFKLTGGDTGGGIYVNAYARHLEISNNVVKNNASFFGGGIRLGQPFLVDAATSTYSDAQNTNVRIHHNRIIENGGLGGAGGGVALHTGSDLYQVTDNFICGNFSQGDGGGIGHLGLSDGGLIARNTILFNENFKQLGLPAGGGIFVGGGAPIGGLSPGAGSVTIADNLIQGNAAQVADGGGIHLSQINGQDVVANPDDPTAWYEIEILNNMIVDNVTALAGGGISMSDAARVSIIHNTIAHNDSTATSGAAFTPGVPNASNPQSGVGIASHAHTPALAAAFGASPAVASLRDFSNPELVNNIIWQNRRFTFTAVPAATPPVYSLLPDLSVDPPIFDDLAVLGTATSALLNPISCDLTDATLYDPSNISLDPLFVREYFNGNRSNTIKTPEATTGLQVPVAFDEGGNFIRVRFGPLTQAITTGVDSGALYGDYHIALTSPAQDAAVDVTVAHPAALADFDGDPRPSGGAADIGADERQMVVLALNNGGGLVRANEVVTRDELTKKPAGATNKAVNKVSKRSKKANKRRKAKRKHRRQLKRKAARAERSARQAR